jgi:hypothetical protein
MWMMLYQFLRTGKEKRSMPKAKYDYLPEKINNILPKEISEKLNFLLEKDVHQELDEYAAGMLYILLQFAEKYDASWRQFLINDDFFYSCVEEVLTFVTPEEEEDEPIKEPNDFTLVKDDSMLENNYPEFLKTNPALPLTMVQLQQWYKDKKGLIISGWYQMTHEQMYQEYLKAEKEAPVEATASDISDEDLWEELDGEESPEQSD